MKHQSMINALANHGLNPEKDSDNPNRFLVDTGEVMGSWVRDENGKVFLITTREKGSTGGGRAHITFPAFLNHLLKNPNRKIKEAH